MRKIREVLRLVDRREADRGDLDQFPEVKLWKCLRNGGEVTAHPSSTRKDGSEIASPLQTGHRLGALRRTRFRNMNPHSRHSAGTCDSRRPSEWRLFRRCSK